MTWTEGILQAFENLGGVASYSELYEEIRKIRSELPESWKKVIQRHIQDRSSDSNGFKNKEDLFYVVGDKGDGVWGLRSHKKILPGEVLTNNQLKATFLVDQSGGMRRSHAKKSLVIVSDATKSLYDDKWISNNVIHFTGMGPSGDQDIEYAQNSTLAHSLNYGVDVNLFEVFTQNNYVYAGEVELCGEPFQEQQVGEDGNSRLVYMFPLRLKSEGSRPLPDKKQLESISTIRKKSLRKKSEEEIKRRAEIAQNQPAKRTANTEVIIRNEAVVEYVKHIANGICDLCEKPAPFINKYGEPFLECHHIVRLADGGEDSIRNAVALCPNCHRKMHSLNLKVDIDRLVNKVLTR